MVLIFTYGCIAIAKVPFPVGEGDIITGAGEGDLVLKAHNGGRYGEVGEYGVDKDGVFYNCCATVIVQNC